MRCGISAAYRGSTISLRDVRHGVRTLRRSPAFTAVALLTLALGIGANTAIYQLVDAIRLRTLPVKDPQQIAIVELADLTRWKGRRTTGYPVLTNPLWEQFRDHQTDVHRRAGLVQRRFQLDRDAGARSARGLFVSGEFFKVLGIEPLLGRVFTAADDRAGCGVPGAVVSYGFWQRQLGGDPAAIGRTVALNSRPVEVIGITPPSFPGLEVGRSYDVAVPICAQDVLAANRAGSRAGRPGGSLSWVAWRQTDRSRPSTRSSRRPRQGLFEATCLPTTQGTRQRLPELQAAGCPRQRRRLRAAEPYSDPLLVLLVTSALVLLIACTNLANLILARASAREREFAVRLAIGASWSRLVRQLMVENGLLAVAGPPPAWCARAS